MKPAKRKRIKMEREAFKLSHLNEAAHQFLTEKNKNELISIIEYLEYLDAYGRSTQLVKRVNQMANEYSYANTLKKSTLSGLIEEFNENVEMYCETI